MIFYKHLRKTLLLFQRPPSFVLRFSNHQRNGHLYYCDVACANLSDRAGSMGRHILLLAGINNLYFSISWSPNTIKRVLQCIIAAEALSLQEGLKDGRYRQELIN